jgi:hypothetical protein
VSSGSRAVGAIKFSELAVLRNVVQRFFHRRVGQAEPLLQIVGAQHRLDAERRSSGLGRGESAAQRYGPARPTAMRSISARNSRLRVLLPLREPDSINARDGIAGCHRDAHPVLPSRVVHETDHGMIVVFFVCLKNILITGIQKG